MTFHAWLRKANVWHYYHEQQVICLDISISSLFTVHCCLVDFVAMKCFEMLWNALKCYYGCMFLYIHSHRLMYETWAFIILMTIFCTQTHTPSFTHRHCIVFYWAVVWNVKREPHVCSIISKIFLISIWHISNWIVYT